MSRTRHHIKRSDSTRNRRKKFLSFKKRSIEQTMETIDDSYSGLSLPHNIRVKV